MRHAAAVIVAVGLAFSLAGCGDQAKGPAADQGKHSPGPAPGKTALRVNAGADKEYVDPAGVKWLADQQYAEGKNYGAVAGTVIQRGELKTPDGAKLPDLYRTERYSMTAYRFDAPNGKYTVRLHFCETFDGITKAGERVFSVKIQGQPVLTDFDVFKEAGAFAKPVVKEFKGVAVSDGKLLIEFAPKVQNPEINGIEVLAE